MLDVIITVTLVVIGFIFLMKGADFLVDGASNIAKRFHIPEMVIGLTIVSIGTSMPELVVSLQSAIQGQSDIAVGNVIGSNIANLFLILGLCSVIKSLKFKKETRLFENPFTIIITTLLLIMGNTGEKITRIEGLILVALCVLFIVYNIYMVKKGEEFDSTEYSKAEKKQIKKEEKEAKNVSIVKSIFSVIIGILALKFGGDFVVNGCTDIATMIGISEKLISLTIIAISTSLPELMTSISATRKGETDIAIGNVIGSQIFNILLIIGVSATISPISYTLSYNKDIILLLIGTIMLSLFPRMGKMDEMTRKNGLSFVTMYSFYIVSLVIFNG